MKKKLHKLNPIRRIRRTDDMRPDGSFLLTVKSTEYNSIFHEPVSIYKGNRESALVSCRLYNLANQPVYEINLDPENPTIIAHSSWDFRQMVAEAKYNRLMKKNKKTMESVLK